MDCGWIVGSENRGQDADDDKETDDSQTGEKCFMTAHPVAKPD